MDPRLDEVLQRAAQLRELDPRWHEWASVKVVLAEIAERIVR